MKTHATTMLAQIRMTEVVYSPIPPHSTSTLDSWSDSRIQNPDARLEPTWKMSCFTLSSLLKTVTCSMWMKDCLAICNSSWEQIWERLFTMKPFRLYSPSVMTLCMSKTRPSSAPLMYHGMERPSTLLRSVITYTLLPTRYQAATTCKHAIMTTPHASFPMRWTALIPTPVLTAVEIR